MQSELPKDPYLLLSVVNTALRDEFDSLDDMCTTMGFSKDAIASTLHRIGYHYDKKLKCFK